MAAISKGCLVFVTGVSGLIGSHVADHLLRAGFRVRGAVRSEPEARMMHEIYRGRHPKAADDVFETVVIADMKLPGAFAGHLAGCEGIAHVASDLSFSPDPNVVITGCVNGVVSLLYEAKSTPSIKRFVYTSSSNAATRPLVDEARHVDSSSWNDDMLEEAWAPPPYENRGYVVYAASKVACERAAWTFVTDQKPQFTFNTVLPNYTSGVVLQPLSVPGAGSTARWVRDVYDHPFEEQFVSKLRDDSPAWQVEVEDVAKLHLAALCYDDVAGERLFGFAHKFNYNSFLKVFRELAPERKWPEDRDGLEWSSTIVNTERSIELLRRFGADGWVSFHESVRRSCLSEYGEGWTPFDGVVPGF